MAVPLLDPRRYAVDELLRDGGSIHVRAIRPDDRERLVEHFQPPERRARSTSASSGVKTRLTRRRAATSSPSSTSSRPRSRWSRRCASDGDERIIGVGRYAVPTTRTRAAPRRGRVRGRRRAPGTRHRHAAARAPGGASRAPTASPSSRPTCSARTTACSRSSRKSGFRVTRSLERRRLPRHVPHRGDRRAAAADRPARAHGRGGRSVRGDPRSRARSRWSARRGAGHDRRAPARRTCARPAFTGAIYPVNPQAAADRRPARLPDASSAIGAPVDLAVIAVPARGGRGRRRATAPRAGVRGVVVISAGFAEASDGGPRRAARLRRSRARLGHAHGRPELHGRAQHRSGGLAERHLRADVAARRQRRHAVAERRARARDPRPRSRSSDLGLSTFVSVGNKADVSGNDLLCVLGRRPAHRGHRCSTSRASAIRASSRASRRRWRGGSRSSPSSRGARRPGTRAALEPLGGAREPRRRRRRALRAGRRDPHRHARGAVRRRRAARRRSRCRPGRASASSPTPAAPASCSPTPARRTASTLPELAAATRGASAAFLPPQAGLANPIDMIASATPEQYARRHRARRRRSRRRRGGRDLRPALRRPSPRRSPPRSRAAPAPCRRRSRS